MSNIQGSANSQDDIVILENPLQTFLGHIISSEGIKVYLSKIDAIAKMPVPQFLTEL